MNKQSFITILFILLMSMTGAKTFAHNIEVANNDGVTIYYVWTNNNTKLAVSYRGSESDSYSNEYTGNVVIPESVKYNGNTYPVTSIGNSAFYVCSGLTSINIPNSVTSIGNDAFQYCGSQLHVIVPVTDYSAFCNNDIINLVRTKIGKPVQLIDSEGKKITEYIVPNDVISIGNFAFSGCSGLTSITIPNSITSIGDFAFERCNLSTIISEIEEPFAINEIFSPIRMHY